MLNIFKEKKPGITAISFPNFDWNIKKENSEIRQWMNTEQTMALSINYFDQKPDIPSVKNIDIVRNYYREQISKVQGGLIQVDVVEIQSRKAIKTIFKMPQQPTGVVYLASLTIPFKNCSYVIKLQAPEIGFTGMRESVIQDKLMNNGQLTFGADGFGGWAYDPYDSNYKTGTRMNKSEESIYDPEFKSHPLSQARKLMSEIEKNTILSSELLKLRIFKK